MSLTHHSGQRPRLSDESRSLLEIADLLDLICAIRRSSQITCETNECNIRRELFALIDGPCQDVWERVREIELYPSNFPGLDTPSPLGITVGDLAYGFGLGDVDCPTREQLVDALRWGIREYGKPTLNGNILA